MGTLMGNWYCKHKAAKVPESLYWCVRQCDSCLFTDPELKQGPLVRVDTLDETLRKAAAELVAALQATKLESENAFGLARIGRAVAHLDGLLRE